MKLIKIKLPKMKLVSIFPPRLKIFWYTDFVLEDMKRTEAIKKEGL